MRVNAGMFKEKPEIQENSLHQAPAKLTWLLLCGFLAGIWISPAWGTEIYIPQLTGTPGESIDIPVMIDQVEGLAGVKLVMTYDPKILTFKSGSKTKYTDSLMHIINDKKPGLLIVVMAGARGIKGKDFPILTLKFAINSGLKEDHTVKIRITEHQLMSDKLKDIPCTIRVKPLVISTPRVAGEKK